MNPPFRRPHPHCRVRLLSFTGCPVIPKLRGLLKASGIKDFEDIDIELLSETDPLRGYSSPTLLLGNELILGSKTSNQSLSCSLYSDEELQAAVAKAVHAVSRQE